MGNYWLDKDDVELPFRVAFNFHELVELQKQIDDGMRIDELDYIFEFLTKSIINHLKIDATDDLINECINLCFDKVKRYNGKGPAFNYFTTIIASQIKQKIHRSRKFIRANCAADLTKGV